MKTLKESILNRNNHTGEGFKTQRREMIEKWLNKYKIKNYTINDDFTIDVDGNVDLTYKHLSELPEYIQFNIVKGGFDCKVNDFTSLRGCPKEVGGGFFCNFNELITLEGAPKEVERSFDCSYNKLTSLEGAPKEVGGYLDCSNNPTLFSVDDVKKVCQVKRSIIVR